MNSKKEWESELDSKEWISETGLKCSILRGCFGHWCGYVHLPLKHMYHGIPFDSGQFSLNVHGGISYSSKQILDNCWVVGFDCARPGDLLPYLDDSEGVYRNQEYVVAETEKLAKQLTDPFFVGKTLS